MHAKKSEIFRLMVILIIFSASIWFINENKKSNILSTHIDIHAALENVSYLSLEQAYDHMLSLLTSHNISLVVQNISQFKSQFAYDLVVKIIDNTTLGLSNEEKMKIIFGVASNFHTKKELQHSLFSLLLAYPHLYAHNPALLVLIHSKHSEMIPPFMRWLEKYEQDHQSNDVTRSFIEHAFHVAVADDDCTAVEVLLSKKVYVSKETASALLWHVIENNKDTLFVALLVRHVCADINYSADGKRTLLMRSVENNNSEMVRALLEEGALVDIIDSTYGSAEQIARKCGYTAIASLLT